MIKTLWAHIKAFFYTPVAATESQPKENTVKLALVSIITSMLANGAAANTVQVTLTDNADAVQPGAVVNFTADNGATVDPSSALTDANGQITVSVVSSTVGASTLTATAADGTTASIQVYFVAVPAPVAEVVNPIPAADTAPVALSPLEAMRADFDKVVAFIEHGIEVLGKDAEADLVALKNKFLL
ncbi:Ig-like domain-containing protein [Rahnella aceris]|uniref:Ig-like domain-containing protein n=1 Tax=Rahnella sp. (strain Y9602) TaxID=2703885 RepID=UPI001C26DF1E|nr:Ig-like domain-containing protein [Rahnella aceris]MBU9842161.1 Ig-like domain-containing protein [Rahnella aceris]